MTGEGRLERFNFDTMSGVYPGTRTQVFQRVLLKRPIAEGAESAEREEKDGSVLGAESTWATVFWYEAPPSCVVRIEGEKSALRIEDPLAGDVQGALDGVLAEAGWETVVCGNCAHWRAGAGTTVDGLPLGMCGLRRPSSVVHPPSSDFHPPTSDHRPPSTAVPHLLAAQSTLALGCPFWQHREAVGVEQGSGMVDTGAEDTGAATLPLHPLPKVAEVSESKMKPLRRWQMRLRRWLEFGRGEKASPTLGEQLLERSGVGAGTEHCPCCQGRIANLGALAVADEAGDKQTLSVWRCRVCHALFLSDWIDRWERVDSLETEETIYRIAPVEAAEMLTLIQSVQEAEHPRRRGERGAERAWLLAQVTGRAPVSHVVKQGR